MDSCEHSARQPRKAQSCRILGGKASLEFGSWTRSISHGSYRDSGLIRIELPLRKGIPLPIKPFDVIHEGYTSHPSSMGSLISPHLANSVLANHP